MKVKYLLLYTLLYSINSFSQIDLIGPDEVKSIKSSTLYVIELEDGLSTECSILKTEVKELGEEFEGIYSEECQIDSALLIYNKIYNSIIKSKILNSWEFSDSVVFITYDKFLEVKLPKSYSVLTFDYGTSSYNFHDQNIPKNYFNGFERKYFFKSWDVTFLSLTHYRNNNGKTEGLIVAKGMLPNKYPLESELHLAVVNIQSYLKYRDQGMATYEIKKLIKSNGKERLKDRILLVDEKELSQNLTISDIKKIYPFQVEISDYSKIDSLILNKVSGYATIVIFPTEAGPNTFAHFIYDCGKEDYIGYFLPSPITLPTIGQAKRIKLIHFKKYAKIGGS